MNLTHWYKYGYLICKSQSDIKMSDYNLTDFSRSSYKGALWLYLCDPYNFVTVHFIIEEENTYEVRYYCSHCHRA